MSEQLPLPTEGQDFDAFWSIYPNKQGKAEARKRWAKMSPEQRREASETVIIWRSFWTAAQTEQRFIPHGSTWLNQCRWEDDIPELPTRALTRPRGWDGLDALSALAASNHPARAIGR